MKNWKDEAVCVQKNLELLERLIIEAHRRISDLNERIRKIESRRGDGKKFFHYSEN